MVAVNVRNQEVEPPPAGGASGRRANVGELAERCLRSNAYLALKNISCEFKQGVLTLRGCLPSYYLKQIAQAAVARVEGVERIENQIEVVNGRLTAAGR